MKMGYWRKYRSRKLTGGKSISAVGVSYSSGGPSYGIFRSWTGVIGPPGLGMDCLSVIPDMAPHCTIFISHIYKFFPEINTKYIKGATFSVSIPTHGSDRTQEAYYRNKKPKKIWENLEGKHEKKNYCLELAQDGLPCSEADEFVPDLVDNVIDDMNIHGGDAIRHFRQSSTQKSEKQIARTASAGLER